MALPAISSLVMQRAIWISSQYGSTGKSTQVQCFSRLCTCPERLDRARTSLLMTAHPPAEYLPSRRYRTRRQVTGREKRSRVDRQGAKLLSGLGFQGGKLCFQLSVGGENGGWLDLGWVECQSPISRYQRPGHLQQISQRQSASQRSLFSGAG